MTSPNILLTNHRILIVNPPDVARLIQFAKQPENWYRPNAEGSVEEGCPIPGDQDSHTLKMGDYKVVFSWTVFPHPEYKGMVFRHLSVSVPQDDPTGSPNYPNPVAFEAIGHALGFTGALNDWSISPYPDAPVIVAAQRIYDYETPEKLQV